MDLKLIEKCAMMINSNDSELAHLGERMFLGADPSYEDIFVLHCRVIIPEERRLVWGLEPFQSTILKRIKRITWKRISERK